MKGFPALIGCVLFLFASALPAAERPNIVLIFSDDQGMNDIGCYGSEIATPHIDSLARDGLKFNSFYVASSICTPSRFGLLTGRNPSRSRDGLLEALMFQGDADKQRGIRPDETTIASVLRQSGYRTALIGKWHLGHGQEQFWPTRHGFDYFYGHTAGCVDFFTLKYGNEPDWYRNRNLVNDKGFATELLTREAVRYLHAQKEGQPFFLFLAYNAPHFGKGWDEAAKKPVNILQPRPQELERVRHIEDPKRRDYAAMVTALDDGVGTVLETLKATGLADNTLVIFMTDHGGDPVYGGSNLPFRGDKATLFEGGIRVPCLMRWPGRIKPGTVTDSVASALDLFPTFCRLAGIEHESRALDGRDISDLLAGGSGGPRELFWELGAHAELERGNWMALRQGRWKYVRTNAGEEFLFNISSDPHEKTNLAGSNPDRLKSLRDYGRLLAATYRATSFQRP